MAKMLSAFAKGSAGIESAEVREVDIPEPGEGEALIRLKAATLNYRDLAFITGILPASMVKQPEYVPFSCGLGEVVALGSGVTEVAEGDRVTPLFSIGWLEGRDASMEMLGGPADGVARQYAVFPAHSLVTIPDMMGDMEAATLPCAGLTAWSAVTQYYRVGPGDWVLTHGTGGVSLAAMQFAKALGANVAITSSSDAKLNRARSMGADVTVNYRTSPDWEAEVRDAIGGDNVAVVVDVVGKEQFKQNAALLRDDGLIAAIGMLGDGFSWDIDVGNVKLCPISVGNREEHREMVAFMEEHTIRPAVDVVYNLHRIQDAYRHLQSGEFFGKVAVNLL